MSHSSSIQFPMDMCKNQFAMECLSILSALYRPISLDGHVESHESLHDEARTEFAPGRGLLCKTKAFYSSETQHGPA